MGQTPQRVNTIQTPSLLSAEAQQQTASEDQAEGSWGGTQAGPRPKLAVQLDLPHEEQTGCSSSSCQAAACQPLQQQQLDPLLVLGTRFKPSISSAVMLQRAHYQQQTQEAAREQMQREHDCPNVMNCSSAEQPSTPITCDAAVHITRAALDDKQQTHQQPKLLHEQHACGPAQQHKLATATTGSWQTSGSRGIDALAKRVHANKELHCELGPVQQHQQQAQAKALTWGRTWAGMLHVLKVVFWDVVQPGDIMVLLWDVVMLVLIIYICIVCPFTVAFAVDFTDLTHPLAQLDLAASCLFMLDCWMNFRTAYIGDDGRVVSCRCSIAAYYLQGWFAFDFVSSLPYEQILSTAPLGFSSLAAFLKVPRLLRIVKMLRLVKLLKMTRLLKLPHLMSRLQWLLNRPLMQLSTMCAGVCLLLHWVACVWYYVAVFVDDNDNWVASSGLAGSTDGVKYVTALYWSISTVATVGFGDVVAHSLREKIVALVVMLIGASVFGYFMGAVSVMVSATNSNRARMTAKRRAVDDFLMHRRVPRALSEKVKSYFDYVVEREVQADEADIIAGLSANLRTQVVLHLYQEALEKVPFFKGRHPHFITSVVTCLQLEYYAPGDFVVRQGDLSDTMYFLAQGSLEVRLYQDEGGCPLARPTYHRSSTKAQRPSTPCQQHNQEQESQQPSQQRTCGAFSDWLSQLVRRRHGSSSTTGSSCGSRNGLGQANAGTQDAAHLHELPAQHNSSQWTYEDELAHRPYRQLGHLQPGEYFGEYSCLLGQECSATVVASSYVEVYSLRRSDLETVLQQWPELAEQFEALVQEAGSQALCANPVTPMAAVRSSCTPLAHWSLVKAAYHQHSMSSSQVQHTHTSSMTSPGAVSAQQAPTTTSSGPTGPQEQAAACVHTSPCEEGGQQLQQQEGLQADENGCDCWCQQASPGQQSGRAVLQQTRSEPIGIDAAAAAGSRGTQWQWQSAQRQQDWDAVQTGQWGAADAMRVSIPEDPTSAGSAVYSAPSLAARSVSMLSNMSGLPAGSRAQRSGSLSRRSVPTARVSSMSGGGSSVNLARATPPGAFGSALLDPRRPMNRLPGQGTGLFRTKSGQRYLFPAFQDRSGALLPQPQAQDEPHPPGGSVLQQQRSLTRHSMCMAPQDS